MIRSVLLIAVWLFSTVTLTLAQTVSKYIVVDQFGYRPNAKKIAIIRDPQTGFDQAESFTPGTTYAVIKKSNGQEVMSGALTNWNSGTTDASSGDKVKWFDFSSVTDPGKYYILDVSKNLRSFEFEIREDVYEEMLRHAVRTFFYQRAGFAKTATYAGAAWADGVSHMKNLQDKNARQYNKTADATSELNVSGGWYDAGDYNKYTNWTANYVVEFMRAYIENPEVWLDDYNLPESGNGTPDLLDEATWGIDHLLRMQRSDGSVLSIVGLSHASPPSTANGPSYYGTASTSATLNTAAAFALASKVFAGRGMTTYADLLKEKAILAWTWADANPNVIFKNNDPASGTGGLGAGQQEVDDYGRLTAKLEAACFLFDLTGDTAYRTFFDSNYDDVHLIAWNYAYPFEPANQELLLHYTTIPGATPSVVTNIKNVYKNAMNSTDNFGAYTSSKDPYRAYIKDYTWGSNLTKANQGLMFTDMIQYSIDASKDETAREAAEGFIHYIHGVNPFNMVYLSNMYEYGGENCVNEFYHTWFANGSAKWDRVGTSTYGPAPGYLVGGPNPSYDWDGCCPGNCGGSNAVCNSESLTPPKGQPAQKSYKDFNTSWPLNSWSVTENSDGYQIGYIRLLAKFVVADGPDEVTGISERIDSSILVSPNPTTGLLNIAGVPSAEYQVRLVNNVGKTLLVEGKKGASTLNLSPLASGVYLVMIRFEGKQVVRKVIKN